MRPSSELAAHEAYVPIPRRLIAAGAVTGVHLYLRVGDRYVLYRSGHTPVDGDSLEKLRRRAVEVLYVRAAESPALHQYVSTNLERLIAGATTAEQETAVLREATQTMLRSTLHRLDTPESYRQVRTVSDVVTQRVAEDVSLLPGLVRFAREDEQLFVHAANVAAYAVALAARSPGFAEHDLRSIGVGALVRDVGLTTVEGALLLKPEEERTDIERDYLSRHPRRGVAMLRRAEVDDPIVLEIVLHHHAGEARSLPPHAAIVRLADAFDAMTSQADPRERQGPFAALYQMRHRIDAFPPELVREFVMMLGSLTTVDVDSPIAPLTRRIAAAGLEARAGAA